MSYEHHLSLAEVSLHPGSEWDFDSRGWFVVRIARGTGYLLSDKAAHDLKEGDVLSGRSSAPVRFRSSQLTSTRLQFFCVYPELLGGVLTLAERRLLESFADAKGTSWRFYPAIGTVARRFAQICEAAVTTSDWSLRCQQLELFGLTLAEDLEREPRTSRPNRTSTERFKQLIEQMAEAELESSLPQDLARRCGCSGRHFSRLFRDYFGRSVRSKQIELRLEKAQRLLHESDAKVIEVALESGYRHLGLFNAMFKRRFGMTPSEWRGNRLPKPRNRRFATPTAFILLLLAGLTAGWPAELDQPQTPPGAAVATAKTNSPTLEIRGFDVQGNTVLPQKALDGILSDYTGPAVTFDKLRQGLAELQLAYRGRGYETVAVALPQQQLTNGVVRVQVTEGRLAEINIINNRHFSSNNIMRSFPYLRTNILLNSQFFQPELDRANANQDRQIYPVISPGPEPGTTALTLKVKDRLPLHGRVELNNQATPGTPPFRINASAQYNNLWQLDHQIGFQYGFSPGDFKETSPPLTRFYDYPLIANYSAYYRMPISFKAGTGEINPSDFGYDEVTKKFRLPAASGQTDLTFFASRSSSDTGVKREPFVIAAQTPLITIRSQGSGEDLTTTENLGLRLSKPLKLLPGGIRSFVSIGIDFKDYRLSSFNTNTFYSTIVVTNNNTPQVIESSTFFAQPPRNQQISYLPLNVRWDASRADRFGTTSFGIGYSANLSLIRVEQNPPVASGASSFTGRYQAIINPSFSREQRIYEDWTLLVRADGQWANEPLISNEQFGLGGTAGVRGYEEGEQFGDTGWRVLMEPRTPSVDIGMVDGTMPMRLRGSIFTDYGEVYSLDARSPQDRTRMWGAGFGVVGSIGETFNFRLTLSWALRDTAKSNAGGARAYFGISAQF